MPDNRSLIQKISSAKEGLERKVRKLELVLKRLQWAISEFDNIGHWEAQHLLKIIDGHFEGYPSQRCYDCKVHAEWYMVKNEVWSQAWFGKSKLDLVVDAATRGNNGVFLCLSSLSTRIGRPLEFEDFSDVKANDLLFWAKKRWDEG